MATNDANTVTDSRTSGGNSQIKSLLTWLGLAAVVALLAAVGFTLLDHQNVEKKRIEIARSGGRVTIEKRVPDWLASIVGKNFHSMLDRSVIVGVEMIGPDVNDDSVKSLEGLTEITSLGLQRSQITNDALKTVSSLKTLVSLNLENTPLTELTGLEQLSSLEFLNLGFSKVRDEKLREVSQIPKLRSLNLEGTQIKDAGIVEIGKCTTLQELNMRGSKLGENGLMPLKNVATLKTLILEFSTVDPKDLEAFKQALPGCAVSI